MQLELTHEDVEILRQVLAHKVEELDKEINRTDSLAFKRELQRVDRTLDRILAQLTGDIKQV